MSSSSSDQLPSLGDAWRRLRGALSVSSIVRVRGDTGTHLFHVGRYSRVDGQVSPGQCIESSVFRAGGRKWKLFYYPNGADERRRGQVCAQLMLVDSKFPPSIFNVEATAEYRLSVLGGDGRPAHSCAVGARSYIAGWKPAYGIDVLATARERSSALSLVEDDSLVVRCDVTVLNVDMESRIMCYLRKLWNYN